MLLSGWCVAKKGQIRGKERENKKVGSFVGVCFYFNGGNSLGLAVH